ncbi:MAG: hypothetical protein ACHQ0J_02465 [Candidatus Dormibacterales bacterium]
MSDQGEGPAEPAEVPAAEHTASTPPIEVSRGPNTLALVSFIAAVLYFGVAIGLGVAGHTAPIWLVVLPLVAVLAGYVARGQTQRNGRGGSYLALLGMVFGFIALALLAFGLALALLTAR